MIVRELITLLGFRVDNSNLIIYNQTINNTYNAAQRASNAMQGLFALVAAGAAIGGIVKIADELQSIEARIKKLPQTVGSASDAFDAVAKRAQAANQNIEGYATFYIKAANATQDFIKSQEGVMDVVDGVGFALAAAGTSATGQKQALFQLGQAIGSPTIQMEEMNTVIDVAPDLFRALGKAIPGAEGNLKKFISTGKVTGRMLAEALVKVMPEFRAQMLDMPLSMGTATTLMANRWKTFIHRMNRESGAITAVAKFFLSSFDKIEAGLNNMTDFFGGASNTLKFFGIALAAVFTPILFKAAAATIGLILSPIGLLVTGLLIAGLAIEDFYKWMKGGKSIFGQFFGTFEDGKKRFEEFKKTVIEFFTTGTTGEFVAKFVELKNGIREAFNGGVITKFISLIVKVGKYFYKVIPFKWIAQQISNIFSGLIKIFFGVFDVIAGAFKILIGFLTGDFDLMYEGLGQIVSGLVDVFEGVWKSVKASVLLLLMTIGILFKAYFDYIKYVIIEAISNAFKAAADAGMAYLKAKLSGALGIAVDAAVDIATSMIPVPLKNAMGLGESTTFTPYQQKPIIPLEALSKFQPTPTITPSVVAGSASAAGGVAQPMFNVPGQKMNINVYQTLPAGTSAETAKSAKDATTKAADSAFGPLARQIGQLQ